MSCDKGKISTKKKIAIFSSIGAGIIAVAYFTFIITNNPTIFVTLPATLAVAACPAMCIGIGAIIAFGKIFSKNKNIDSNQEISSSSYYNSDNDDVETISKKQQELTKDANDDIKHT